MSSANPWHTAPTIFVIDDDEVVRESLRVFLEASHYAVEDFCSGEAFLARVDGHGADCVLLDISMPRMSGIEALQALRRKGYTAPVILMTGAASHATHVQAQRMGVRLLEKPIPPAMLVTAIEQALGRGEGEPRP
ncbi:MAG: response regulator [Alphaproteobacteria bacterium]|nr:response regulator [Alphaproteobacteria bacterium]